MKFLDARRATQEIRRGVLKGGSARLIVAFWGDGAATRLGIADRPQAVSVVCNLKMGGTNPDEIRRLINLGVDVQQCDELHGKVYMFDDRVVIGSSNASSNGLAFQEGETTGWAEANVMSADDALLGQTKAWAKKLRTRPISDADLDAAAEAWRRRRQAMTPAHNAKSLLDMARTNPSFFDGKGVYLAIYGSHMDEEGWASRDQLRAEFSDEIDAFQDWPELEQTVAEGHLVCFWRGPRGGTSLDGLWKRTSHPKDYSLPSGSRMHPCWEVPDIFGLSVRPDEIKGWKLICSQIQHHKNWDAESACGLIDMAEVARKYVG